MALALASSEYGSESVLADATENVRLESESADAIENARLELEWVSAGAKATALALVSVSLEEESALVSSEGSESASVSIYGRSLLAFSEYRPEWLRQ